MTLALGCLLADAFPHMRKHKIRDVPLAYVVSCCTAVATAALWAVCRNRDWAWMLQDALGATLIMFFIRTIQLPSLKVCFHVTCSRKSIVRQDAGSELQYTLLSHLGWGQGQGSQEEAMSHMTMWKRAPENGLQCCQFPRSSQQPLCWLDS